MSGANQFREFAAKHGYELPANIEPGKFIRFQTNGKQGDDAGWARLFEDCEGGIVGDWRTGAEVVWQAKQARELTPQERIARQAKIDHDRREVRAQRENEAAMRARAIWEAAPPAFVAHPYLETKRIPGAGLKLYQGPELVIGGVDIRGALLMPFRNAQNELRTLEFIAPDGQKRFLPGGSYAGCYLALGRAGEKPGDVLCICEGAATAISIQNRTQRPVRAAGTAGNLLAVAQAMRAKLPNAKIILCADNDTETDGNPGVTKATEAAQAVGGFLAVCPSIDGKATDFNDLANTKDGTAAVRAAIGDAKAAPPVSTIPQKSSSGDPGGPELVTRCFADIKPEPINWLWPDQIARGKLTVIAGDPGLGKSQITASLAAIVSTGGHWPVDRTPCEKGRVVFLSAEDDVSDTIRPRLDAAGADVSLCHVIERVKTQARNGSGPVRRAFNLKADMDLLSELLVKLGDVALVIIDPVSAYMGDTDTHRNADVRAVLAEVSEVAGKHKAAFIAVSHLNKGESEKALQRVTGSLAFVAAARAAFLVGQDPHDEEQRLFVPMKNNIGPDSTGYAYRIEGVQFPGGVKTSRISWSEDRVTVTADEALSTDADGEGHAALTAAREFLEVELSGGALPTKQIRKDAEDAGHKWRTVQRAKRGLSIEAVKRGVGKDGFWEWQLPATNLKDAKYSKDSQGKGLAHLEDFGALKGEPTPETPVAELEGTDPEGVRL